ncbi:hypothetical protein RCC89_12765 [Cytophagaceae bacterium ABcell3]|nr:hypothetical protein RCC89_12765 [Cytophagaceae bacterium ABcell3]
MLNKNTISKQVPGLFMAVFFCVLSGCLSNLKAQPVPSSEENIPFLVTFGKDADPSWGDDDFSQTFFFVIPPDQKKPVFIRVYDPDTGGSYDEVKGVADTKTKFSIYGGKGCITDPAATSVDPEGKNKSGILIASKTFGNQSMYDKNWYSFGPFNPVEGEYVKEYGGYVFKVIAEGISGDDGNLYKYFLSSSPVENIPIEGANSFTFEYTFRLPDKAGSVSHIYPFVSKDVVAVKIHTFDFDYDGRIRIVSVAKKHEDVQISGDNDWVTSTHKISDQEKNTSLDIQIIKTEDFNNNNVVFYITNQYGKALPFYTSPIGGTPKFKYEIGVKPFNSNK